MHPKVPSSLTAHMTLLNSLLSYCIYYAKLYPEIYGVAEFEWSDFSFDHYTKQFSFSYEKIASLGLLAIIRSTFKHDLFFSNILLKNNLVLMAKIAYWRS